MSPEEFTQEYAHFLDCINWDASHLDARAIRFMNEAPQEIRNALTYVERANT